jgi:hypothetical protein
MSYSVLNSGSDSDVDETRKTRTPVTKSNKEKRKTRTVEYESDDDVTVIKKGPGRPRKTPKKEPMSRKGIYNTPQAHDSFLEVCYDQPIVLKKIFQFFGSIAAAQIQIIFRPTEIIFYGIDHHSVSKVRVRIDASKLNGYYCRDTLDIGIATDEIELIMNKVDKEYASVIIYSEISNTQKNITFVLENDMQIDEIHHVELIGQYPRMENENLFTDETYQLKFVFPSKYFKKTISDIKTMSLQLSIIQEDPEAPLMFKYINKNKHIQSTHAVKDNASVKLISNVETGNSIRVDIRVDHLKPISSAMISDDIYILVDENRALMTKSFIDNSTI